MNVRIWLITLLTAATSTVLAGNLDAPGTPATGSGMPTTPDIYNRLDGGAAIGVPGTFQEPLAGPTVGSGRTMAEIGSRLPAPDNVNGAMASEVANGKTFWGLRADGTWALTSGTRVELNPSYFASYTCAGARTGAHCQTCLHGWSGTNCDIIAKPSRLVYPITPPRPGNACSTTAPG